MHTYSFAKLPQILLSKANFHRAPISFTTSIMAYDGYAGMVCYMTGMHGRCIIWRVCRDGELYDGYAGTVSYMTGMQGRCVIWRVCMDGELYDGYAWAVYYMTVMHGQCVIWRVCMDGELYDRYACTVRWSPSAWCLIGSCWLTCRWKWREQTNSVLFFTYPILWIIINFILI